MSAKEATLKQRANSKALAMYGQTYIPNGPLTEWEGVEGEVRLEVKDSDMRAIGLFDWIELVHRDGYPGRTYTLYKRLSEGRYAPAMSIVRPEAMGRPIFAFT